MDDKKVLEIADILIACHGSDAEPYARRHARKCLRRGQPEWAELYEKVAKEIARRQPPTLI
jgi:hypothetical protein